MVRLLMKHKWARSTNWKVCHLPRFLKPGESLIHHHAVFHFTGDEKGLNTIAEKVLGVSLESIKSALS